jgi:hypothetical protein
MSAGNQFLTQFRGHLTGRPQEDLSTPAAHAPRVALARASVSTSEYHSSRLLSRRSARR